MLIVAGEIRMKPGTRDRFLAAVGPLVAATIEEAGCHTYAFTPDPTDADLIRLYELWDGEPSLAAHFESAHIAAWQEVRATLPIVSSSLHKYIVTDSVPLG
jgi:quinol monooxygenase YgiN